MSAIDRKHRYAPGGPISKNANTAGAKARCEERANGLPVSALAPSAWGDHPVTREAWVTGYMSEVKARGYMIFFALKSCNLQPALCSVRNWSVEG